MKKILFMISQLHKGGAETSLVQLLKELDPQEYQLDLLIMNQVPVKGAVSLVDQIPEYVHVCNVYEKDRKHSGLYKRFILGLRDEYHFSETAIGFVQKKEYDLAVHVGEWWIPAFLAMIVKAKRKAAWLHADINRSRDLDEDRFFAFDEQIDYYLFVSQHSMEAACTKYPFLSDRALILHNAIDKNTILEKSQAQSKIVRKPNVPLLVTVANIRVEKGHLRAVKAMKVLKDRGRDFIWWNIGHKSSEATMQELQSFICKHGLEERFLLLGADDNPYPMMLQADAVACLSDAESWSLVVTEAKILGKPIIATKTSGAVEQIENGITGLITDFDEESVADAIEKMLFDDAFRKHMESNLKKSDIPDAVSELASIIQAPTRAKSEENILYIIDDVNYKGGAHAAAFGHIRYLQSEHISADILSGKSPSASVRSALPGIRFLSFQTTYDEYVLHRPLLKTLISGQATLEQKKNRCKQFVAFHRGNKEQIINQERDKYIQNIAKRYRKVVVLSEGSDFKELISQVKGPEKIQWVHTDYLAWRTMSDYTREKSKNDLLYWNNMDRIVVLSEKFRASMAEKFPEIAPKLTVVGNLQPETTIREKALAAPKIFNKVIVDCRGLPEKYLSRMMKQLEKMHNKGYNFIWLFINGNGQLIHADSLLRGKIIEGISSWNEMPKHLLKGTDAVICTPQTINEVNEAACKINLNIFMVADQNDETEPFLSDDHVATSIESAMQVRHMDEDVVSEIFHHLLALRKNKTNRKHILSKTSEPIELVSCFRFEPVKNITGILQVVSRLKDLGITNFRWTFVGDGEQYELAVNMATYLGIRKLIRFAGHQNNPYPFIANADVFVQFSRYEGLPNTIYEALILGKPVVSTDVGAISDQIIPGQNGWLIEPDEFDLFYTLSKILMDHATINKYKENLKGYSYDQETVKRALLDIMR